ncbi:MAG: hypothetical protein QOF00_2678 [Pseudonocardiales bacterium]|jgi:hypothetical protein|nr:hypothetical protein [Pseudonocardiales bacterium]
MIPRTPQPRPARHRFLTGARVALIGAAAAAGALAVALLPAQPSAAQPVPATLTAPVLAAPTASLDGAPVDGIASGTTEQLSYHIHTHLQIYLNGQPRAVPYGIGVVAPLQLEQTAAGPFVVGGTAFYWLHTHDSSGVIHIESPTRRVYRLGEFFDLWGQPLGPEQVGPAHGPVTALVNGSPVRGDPRDIPLAAHDLIQLDVGAAVAFQPYHFPPGL